MNLAVFDIDGTLIKYHKKRNDRAFVKAVYDVFRVQIEDSWSAYKSSTDSGILMEIIEANFKRSCEPNEIKKFKRQLLYWLQEEYGTEPFEATEGAKDVISSIRKSATWSIAIATGNFGFSGKFKLESAGLDINGIALASADDGIGREDILVTAMKRAGRAFERIVYIGDWIWDVKAAKNLGWDFIGIGSGDTENALRVEGAKKIFPDFVGILNDLELL